MRDIIERFKTVAVAPVADTVDRVCRLDGAMRELTEMRGDVIVAEKSLRKGLSRHGRI